MTAEGLRLVGYVRVSTDAQLEGYGLIVQRERIARWVAAAGAELVGVYADEGVSGVTDAADRDGLTAALDVLAAAEAVGLVVLSLDRLARRLDVQEATLAAVWRLGGRAFTVDAGEVLTDDPDDPMRSFVRKVLGLVSELEAATIAARLRRGRQAKRADGGYAGGQPPYGWRAHGGQLVPAPREAEVAAEIRRLRAAGFSLRAIAEILNEGDVPTRHGARWHPTSVRRVAHPEVLVAEAGYDQRRRLRDGVTHASEVQHDRP